MATKAQHARAYAPIPRLLRVARQQAGLTQRELGDKLRKPQSWVYNCETGNRRVDVTEFCFWFEACGRAPADGLPAYLRQRGQPAQAGQTGDVR